VLIASFFVQIFALVSPLFFQVVIDKVLTHRGYSTLFVLVAGLAGIGLFDVALQYLRTYALSHTTNRIDVELGQRLFRHLARLPVSYFETRPTGQTVARMRELETIRAFLTGQGLFSALDLLFAFVFFTVLFAYSWKLTLIVLATIPVYLLIAGVARPLLRERLNDKFNRGAESQQFLVESIVGTQTIKAAAVEPVAAAQWEERLAAYVRAAFSTTMLGAKGQNAIQYVNKLSTAALLLFGAKAVLDGELTVGELVAFNMIAGQVAQPVLRLSQLWQDFQQVQVSVERLGDILNAPGEPSPTVRTHLPPPQGKIEFRDVSFRYRPGAPLALKHISMSINPGAVIGIVGPSGSGKSTLTKLVQRFYIPEEGQVLLDGVDLSHVDPSWLRSNIGVALQDNLLFNRTIHENIALSDPAMPRAQVMTVARLAGADEFIDKLPQGYDTMIEERGANLSGGQRQRIAIARALAPNPPILIFDEATSALDYESERIIQHNMRQIVRNRTVFIIAHRLAAVRDCDRAPIAGRVQSSIITNIGQVVTSGQEIMRIVPQDSKLEIEAYVLNRDIGFVSVGQEAVVKLESFPFTRYGSITAHVKAIAKDAIPAPDASAIEGDPAHASTTAGFAGAERTQNLVFAVELEPQASTISVDGVDQPLTSGMAVTVELKTGARRLFEYIFSPLVETASRAMRER